MKKLSLLAFALCLISGAAHASCSVEMAKSYVMGLEAVAAGLTNIETGYKANGSTLAHADEMAVAGDHAYLVTVTNTASNGWSTGGNSFSKYLVVLKEGGSYSCFPASITLLGNSSTK